MPKVTVVHPDSPANWRVFDRYDCLGSYVGIVNAVRHVTGMRDADLDGVQIRYMEEAEFLAYCQGDAAHKAYVDMKMKLPPIDELEPDTVADNRAVAITQYQALDGQFYNQRSDAIAASNYVTTVRRLSKMGCSPAVIESIMQNRDQLLQVLMDGSGED